MTIYVQGVQVKLRPLLSELHDAHEKEINIDRFLTTDDKEYCKKHGRSPYSVTVHVSGPAIFTYLPAHANT